MPSTCSIPSTSQPLPVSTQQDFNFPHNNHLLITTSSRILSWDGGGLHILFTSSNSGIAAATESKDGSGILAVADKHTVVLHDTKRGQDKSWGLTANEDEVRHLAYTTGSKNLFLSTKVTNAVQCYSTQRQRLLSPPQMLASPPVALAVSPTGHLMLSAEGNPPVVYLKDLVQNTAPTMLTPQGSDKAISVSAFHPERANVFLLAFVDGSLAVYDVGRLFRTGGDGPYMDQYRMGKAEIGRIAELHRSNTAKTSGGPNAIAGAAFIPGHILRVVSVGSDGRCKLVDFTDGGAVLRAWHCKVPLTCVSVYPLSDASVKKASTSRGQEKGTTPSGTIIAVGSEDGKVLLYDGLGLLQARKQVNETGERIVSVEWIAGPSPTAIVTPAVSARLTSPLIDATTPRQRSRRKATLPSRKSSTPGRLRPMPSLQPPNLNANTPSQRASKKFTVHPDEVDVESTVRHTPFASNQPDNLTNVPGPYLDLFSPVNPFRIAEAEQRDKAVSKPPRARPRISSQRFSNDATSIQGSPGRVQNLQHSVVDSHATSSDSWPLKATANRAATAKSRGASTKYSPMKVNRRKASARSPPRSRADRSEVLDVVDPTAATNARLLRDLRQMNAKSATAHAGSVLQGYALENHTTSRAEAAMINGKAGTTNPASQQAGLSKAVSSQRVADTHVHGRDGRWVTDSVNDDSWTSGNDDDIWITSDEERHESTLRKYHLFRKLPAQSPARQTSRSRTDSKGTMSTVNPDAVPSNYQQVVSPDDFTTARSNFSADGTFSPVSEDVRSLFPRVSSLSPAKVPRSTKRRARTSPRKQQKALQDVSANAVLARQPSSPWARAKKAREVPVDGVATIKRTAKPHVHVEAAVQVGHAPSQDVAHQCCAAANSRVDALVSEVTYMKGEIMALKAALRRNGIPAPTMRRR